MIDSKHEGESNMQANINNNRSALFVNEEDQTTNEDILASRVKEGRDSDEDLRIALFRKIKLELSAA